MYTEEQLAAARATLFKRGGLPALWLPADACKGSYMGRLSTDGIQCQGCGQEFVRAGLSWLHPGSPELVELSRVKCPCCRQRSRDGVDCEFCAHVLHLPPSNMDWLTEAVKRAKEG